jgi:hypothetical protein
MAVMMFGTTFANAGIIIADRQGVNDPEPCKEQEEDFDLDGIIIAGIKAVDTFVRTGIIIADRSGIIIADRTNAKETCGIIIAD